MAGYGLPDRLPPGAEPDQLVQLMGRDKKARLGLTFVLDGPRGVEPVTGVPSPAIDRAFAALDGAAGGRGAMILLLSGPNLNLLGQREPDIYGHATLEDHVARARAVAAAHGSSSEHLQSNHEGDLIEAVHEARHRCAGIVINPGAFTHYAWGLHDALAAFDGPDRGAAPVQPQPPGAVAAHVGGVAGGHRHDLRLRRGRLRAGRRSRRPPAGRGCARRAGPRPAPTPTDPVRSPT